jgi:hypothetical protein
MKFHISIMYYFCLYKLHGCWKHLVNQEILKVQKPLSIMDINCQYVGTKSRPNHIFGHLISSFNR